MVQGNPTDKERSLSFTFLTGAPKSKPPEQVAADVVGEIERLKAAIAAFRDSTAHANPTSSGGVCVESCKLFLERARKRVERAQAVVDRIANRKLCTRRRWPRAKRGTRSNALVLERDSLRAGPVLHEFQRKFKVHGRAIFPVSRTSHPCHVTCKI